MENVFPNNIILLWKIILKNIIVIINIIITHDVVGELFFEVLRCNEP